MNAERRQMDRWSDLDETDRVAWSDLANEIEEGD
jgi:hypothetical protein